MDTNMLASLRRYWWIILISIGVIAWAGNKFVWGKDEGETKIYEVKVANLSDEITLSGEVDAKSKADLRFQTSGNIAYVGVKEGDKVKKGQVIAALDKRDLQIRMKQLLNNYSKERHDFEQEQVNNKDWQTKGMSDSEREAVKRVMDKYQKDLDNSVLDVEAQDLSLRFANLWTPIEGIVTQVEIDQAGINITPAGAIFSIVDPKTLIFSVSADQLEVVKFAVGQTGSLTLDAFPDATVPVTIYSIGFVPKSGESGTMYEIKLELNDQSLTDKIRLGMTGDVNFVFAKRDNVVVVPESAVVESEGEKFVRVVKDKGEVKTKVTTGIVVDGEIEVTSGLKENEQIYY